MAAEWFYKTPRGEEVGPIESSNLKYLAEIGEITQDALIRKGIDGKWVSASRVKGLIPVDTALRTTPISPAPAVHSPPPIPRPAVESEPLADYEPTPLRTTTNAKARYGGFVLESEKRGLSPAWWVAGGVGGTLLVVGIVIIGLILIRKVDVAESNQASAQPATSGEVQLKQERQAREEAERRLREAENRAKEAQRQAQEEKDRLARLDEERRSREERERQRQEAERQAKQSQSTKPSEAASERLDIDPAVQGVWKLYATSDDEGKTIKRYDGEVFARVSGTKVRTVFGNDATLTVDKVLIVKDGSGNPANLVKFTNGTLWLLTKEPGKAAIIVAVVKYEGNRFNETFRFLVTCEE